MPPPHDILCGHDKAAERSYTFTLLTQSVGVPLTSGMSVGESRLLWWRAGMGGGALMSVDY